MTKNWFHFKQFSIRQQYAGLKVGTDGVLLGAWAGEGRPKRILDVGTGTGIIALMLAQRYSDAEIIAVDSNPKAVQDARYNFSRSAWKHRFKVLEQRFQEVKDVGSFDLVVSNPPYFEGDSSAMNNERKEARMAENLSLRDFFEKVSGLLSPDGKVQLILPSDQIRDAELEASLHRLYLQKVCKVKTSQKGRTPRVMLSFGRAHLSEKAQEKICLDHSGDGRQHLKTIKLLEPYYLFL